MKKIDADKFHLIKLDILDLLREVPRKFTGI